MNIINGTIHYMIVKSYLKRVNCISLWNTIYHCCDFENVDYITLHSLYDLLSSDNIEVNEITIIEEMLLFILFECTENINY